MLPARVLSPCSPPGTQPLPGRFAGRQTEVSTNYRSPRAGCCRAGPVPGHARAPTPACFPVNCSAAALWETWGASPNWGGLPAVFTYSENLPEAKSFFFHLVRPARLLGVWGPKSYIACLSFEEEVRGSGGDKGRVCSTVLPARDSANRPRRRERPCRGNAERWYLWPSPSCCREPGQAPRTPTGLLHTSFPPISVGQSPRSN